MSRKKITQQKHFSPFGLRLAQIETDSGIQRKDFAKKIGCESPYITQLIEGTKTNPSEMFVKSVCSEFRVNRQWLMTGEGEIYNKDRRTGRVPDEPGGPPSFSTPDYDPEVIHMAREVLASKTHYAASLEANIRSFHDALETKRRLDDHEARLAMIEKAKAEKEDRIRAGDPLEKKEEFLRKRAGP
jgi:transcriptional regulator with XRE-family HTH domain